MLILCLWSPKLNNDLIFFAEDSDGTIRSLMIHELLKSSCLGLKAVKLPQS